jgi:FlaA1/EpsC-like NDP-sugar epimerase
MGLEPEELSAPLKQGLPSKVAAHVRRDVPLALLDLAVVFVAYLAILVLRFDGAVPTHFWHSFRVFIPIVVVLHLLANYTFGLYGQMWRYASIQEARRMVLAGIMGGALVLLAALWVGRTENPLPLSVVALGATISLIGFGAIRFQNRLFALRRRAANEERKRVLLVGAGDAGDMVLKDMLRNASLGLHPVGMVDDDPRKLGRAIHGVRVLGNRASIPDLVKRYEVDQVLFAVPSATSELLREVAAVCEEAGVTLRVLPSVREIVHGKVSARDIRDLRIEDLLGRQQVQTDLAAVRATLNGRRVMVTGAGGSIGSEISRQVLSFEPSALVLLDHDETHLHDLLTDIDDTDIVQTALVDVRDHDRVLQTFIRHRPEVVFHAAAHKHVDLLEIHPEEAFLTNVLGTANLTDAAVATGVERFVLISTDKAVHPKSVMGASKWFAEQIVRSVQDREGTFCAVRFGNVLGSRGSVIPKFFRQIARGGPVTVTDPAMARFFMSVQEAVQLVLQAGALSHGGEVFTLEMGEPVNILDLARNLIRLSGRVPERDVRISFIGARPGEKLVEEIVDPNEERIQTPNPGIVTSRPALPDRAALRRAIREIEILCEEGRAVDVAGRLKELAGKPLAPRERRATEVSP